MADKVEATVILHKETEKALLVSETEDGEKVWLPKSQIEVLKTTAGEFDIIEISLPEWLAKKSGLV